jgi:hypothetical protein
MKSNPKIDPIVLQVVPTYPSIRPGQKVIFAYNTQNEWSVIRNPATGAILRRRVGILFAFRCEAQDVGCRTAGDCGAELLPADEENLGGDRWEEPHLHNYMGDYGPVAYARYETCGDVEKAKSMVRGKPGVWMSE